jgi:hypothetical protein
MTEPKIINGAYAEGVVLQSKYVVERVLGRGGFGITYLCRHTQLRNLLFAVKEYMPAQFAGRSTALSVSPHTDSLREPFERGLKRFIKEGTDLHDCRHNNVARVVDYFSEAGTGYLVMDYVEGDTIAQRIGKVGTMSARDTVALLRPILSALMTVHGRGVIHSDLNPRNVLLQPDTGAPVIIDFGAARRADAIDSRSIMAVVFDGFSPPEQYIAANEPLPRTDVYAVGALGYYCLTGNMPPPSIARQIGDDMKGWGERPPRIAEQSLPPVISKAMALHPAERFQSAAAFGAALTGLDRTWTALDALVMTGGSQQGQGRIDRFRWRETTTDTIEVSGRVGTDAAYDTAIKAIRAAAPDRHIVDRLEGGGAGHASVGDGATVEKATRRVDDEATRAAKVTETISIEPADEVGQEPESGPRLRGARAPHSSFGTIGSAVAVLAVLGGSIGYNQWKRSRVVLPVVVAEPKVTEPAKVTADALSPNTPSQPKPPPPQFGLLGLAFIPAQGAGTRGLYVSDVEPGTDAISKGIVVGDLITEINGQQADTVAIFEAAAHEARNIGRKNVRLTVVSLDGKRQLRAVGLTPVPVAQPAAGLAKAELNLDTPQPNTDEKWVLLASKTIYSTPSSSTFSIDLGAAKGKFRGIRLTNISGYCYIDGIELEILDGTKQRDDRHFTIGPHERSRPLLLTRDHRFVDKLFVYPRANFPGCDLEVQGLQAFGEGGWSRPLREWLSPTAPTAPWGKR